MLPVATRVFQASERPYLSDLQGAGLVNSWWMQYKPCLLLNLKPSRSLLASNWVFDKSLPQTPEDSLHPIMGNWQVTFPSHFPNQKFSTCMPALQNCQHLATAQKNGDLMSPQLHAWFDSICTKPEVVYMMFWHRPHHHHPHMQQWAEGGFYMVFQHRLCHHHLPRMQQRAGGAFYMVSKCCLCHHHFPRHSQHKER